MSYFDEWIDGDAAGRTGRVPTLDDYTRAFAELERETVCGALYRNLLEQREKRPMPQAKELKRGDPCPTCGGELKKAAVPTDDQWRHAVDRENPQALPPGVDTANPEQRKELGELYRCGTCGYTARFAREREKDRERPSRRGDAGREPADRSSESADAEPA